MEELGTMAIKMENLEKTVEEINSKVDKLTELVTQSRIQDKDTENSIDRLKERIVVLEDNQKEIKKEVKEVKEAPTKDKASRWQYIVEYTFKTLVAAAVILLLSKIGINLKG